MQYAKPVNIEKQVMHQVDGALFNKIGLVTYIGKIKKIVGFMKYNMG
ncbi:MAG: hypothetical protein U0Z17_01305 [Bacteroidales bacterium]